MTDVVRFTAPGRRENVEGGLDGKVPVQAAIDQDTRISVGSVVTCRASAITFGVNDSAIVAVIVFWRSAHRCRVDYLN